jgi:hypothetical protein
MSSSALRSGCGPPCPRPPASCRRRACRAGPRSRPGTAGRSRRRRRMSVAQSLGTCDAGLGRGAHHEVPSGTVTSMPSMVSVDRRTPVRGRAHVAVIGNDEIPQPSDPIPRGDAFRSTRPMPGFHSAAISRPVLPAEKRSFRRLPASSRRNPRETAEKRAHHRIGREAPQRAKRAVSSCRTDRQQRSVARSIPARSGRCVSTPRTAPIRQGVHFPQLSMAQNSKAKRACPACRRCRRTPRRRHGRSARPCAVELLVARTACRNSPPPK